MKRSPQHLSVHSKILNAVKVTTVVAFEFMELRINSAGLTAFVDAIIMFTLLMAAAITK
jgi:hypothetical protein